MSEREIIEQKIAQCRRVLTAALDPVTTRRLKVLMTELELKLAQLK
jgi:hypothetical protein